MRQGALCIRGLPVFEDIAHSTHGPNQRLLSRTVNLAAQPVDMDIDHIRVWLNAHAPDLVDRKSTRLNSSHRCISYAVFCLDRHSTRLTSSHRRNTHPCFSCHCGRKALP